MEDCIFCKIVKKESPAIVIDENESVIVFLSLENNPMVVTKKHIKNIYDMDEITGEEVMRQAIRVAKATKLALHPDGINLIQSNEPAAHQDVFHFHLHIKPRWVNDTVKLQWDSTTVDQKTREETKEKIVNVLESSKW